MSHLNELVRYQALTELSQICDPRERERAVTETVNSWTNAELLERISDELEKAQAMHTLLVVSSGGGD